MRELPVIDNTIQFRIDSRNLTDGSQTFAVNITHDVGDECFQGTLALEARTEKDAIELQRKIWDAIKQHTNETIAFFDEGF